MRKTLPLFSLQHGPHRLGRQPKYHVLEYAEERMLRGVKVPLKKTMVPIPASVIPSQSKLQTAYSKVFDNQKKYYINTCSTVQPTDAPQKPHLLLIHGWGGGLGIWINNFEQLSQHYQVHAIDLLGWGLSSRPKYSCGSDPVKAQAWWIESIEAWRKSMNISNLSICGHSLGGFVAASYALKYGGSGIIDKLCLLSPIGLNGFTVPKPTSNGMKIRSFVFNSVWNITPQRLVSFMSPSRVRDMIKRSRVHVAESFHYDDDTVVEYVFRLATTGPVTGAVAFTKLLSPVKGWQLPLRDAFPQLKEYGFPVILAYGADDWIDPTWAVTHISEQRMLGHLGHVYVLPSPCGHHGYTEKYKEFNSILMHGDQPSTCLLHPIQNLQELSQVRPMKRSNMISIS